MLWLILLALLLRALPVQAQMAGCPVPAGFTLEPVAVEVLTVSTTVVGLNASMIADNVVTAAFISLEGTAPLRFMLSGVPSATTGHLIDPPTGGNANSISSTWFCGRGALLALRLIRAGSSDVTVRATYFKTR